MADIQSRDMGKEIQPLLDAYASALRRAKELQQSFIQEPTFAALLDYDEAVAEVRAHRRSLDACITASDLMGEIFDAALSSLREQRTEADWTAEPQQ